MRQVSLNLAAAWGLSLLCGLGHLSHMWAGAPAWMGALAHPGLNAALSTVAMLGPGREIMVQVRWVCREDRPAVAATRCGPSRLNMCMQRP